MTKGSALNSQVDHAPFPFEMGQTSEQPVLVILTVGVP